MDPINLTIAAATLFVILATVITILLINDSKQKAVYLESRRALEEKQSNTNGNGNTGERDIRHRSNGMSTSEKHSAETTNNNFHDNGALEIKRVLNVNNMSGKISYDTGLDYNGGEEVMEAEIIRCSKKYAQLESDVILCGNMSFSEKNRLAGRGTCQAFKGKFGDNMSTAVKLVAFASESDRKFQENQLRKITNQAGTTMSDNLARYYGVERATEDGKLYLAIAFELCEWNLAEFVHMDEMNRMSYGDACAQMGKGLKFLHDIGIAHRNLIPSNVLVKEDNKDGFIFKLSDFGNITRPRLLCMSNDENIDDCSDGWVAPEVYAEANHINHDNGDVSVTCDSKSDIFSLGLLCVFVKSRGANLFASQEHIQNSNAKQHLIEDDEAFRRLIVSMTNPVSDKRPSCDDVIKHPAFWDCNTTLAFLKASSNLIQRDRQLMQEIELETLNVVRLSWKRILSKCVEAYIFSPSRQRGSRSLYCEYSVRFLLRAIRNLSEHFSGLPVWVKDDLGPTTEDHVRYWTDRFPNLLMHVYDTLQRTRTTVPPEVKVYL